MISSKYRFHGHGSLKFLFTCGRPVRSRFFGLKFLRNKHRTEPRIAVIVSKKIFKSAVKRNRIRRRIYEIIRTNFDFSQNYDVALTVFSPEVLTLPQAELLAEMRKLLRGIR